MDARVHRLSVGRPLAPVVAGSPFGGAVPRGPQDVPPPPWHSHLSLTLRLQAPCFLLTSEALTQLIKAKQQSHHRRERRLQLLACLQWQRLRLVLTIRILSASGRVSLTPPQTTSPWLGTDFQASTLMCMAPTSAHRRRHPGFYICSLASVSSGPVHGSTCLPLYLDVRLDAPSDRGESPHRTLNCKARCCLPEGQYSRHFRRTPFSRCHPFQDPLHPLRLQRSRARNCASTPLLPAAPQHSIIGPRRRITLEGFPPA